MKCRIQGAFFNVLWMLPGFKDKRVTLDSVTRIYVTVDTIFILLAAGVPTHDIKEAKKL